MPGSVYCMHHPPTGLAKLGRTSNLTRRMISLLVGVPDPDQYRVYSRSVDGPQFAEAELHDQFAGDRQHGEWFTFTEALQKRVTSKGWVDHGCLTSFRSRANGLKSALWAGVPLEAIAAACRNDRDYQIVVSRRGGASLAKVGDAHGITRERVRQIEHIVYSNYLNTLITTT